MQTTEVFTETARWLRYAELTLQNRASKPGEINRLGG